MTWHKPRSEVPQDPRLPTHTLRGTNGALEKLFEQANDFPFPASRFRNQIARLRRR
jgi:hypothetical protein